MRRGLLVSLVLLIATVAILPARDANAHAALVSSEPANNDLLPRSPTRIRLVFSEPLDTRASGIELFDALGRPIALQPVAFNGNLMSVELEALDPGIYNVLWFNVSAVDGHSLRGSYPFTILNPDGSTPDVVNTVSGIGNDPDPPPLSDGVAVRLLALIALTVAGGAGLLLVAWPEAPIGTRRVLMTAAIGGGALLLLSVALKLRILTNEFGDLSVQDVVFSTRIGGYWLTSLGAAMLVIITASMLVDMPRRAGIGVLAGVALSTYAFAATSHAAAGSGSGWGTIIDLLHGIAAFWWIGAVIAIVFAARATLRGNPPAQVLPRFSLAASLLVFVLVTTGILSTFIEIDSFDRLTTTRYGWTMLAKLALLVPLLGLAFYNARLGKQKLLSKDPAVRRQFVFLAGGEALLGLAVFIPAAMLTQTGVSKSVPVEKAAEVFNQEQRIADLNVSLAVDPNRTGLNSYFVRIQDESGQPVSAERVRLTFRYQDDATVGASTLNLANSGDGVFGGQGPYLTLQGRWRIEVEVRRPDVDDVKAFYDVRPAGPQVIVTRRGGAWDNPAPGLSWNQFGGFVLYFIGLGFALWRRPMSGLGRVPGYSAVVMTALGFGFGTLLLFGVHKDAPTGNLPTNPIFPDQDSITRGRELYQQNCIACHGNAGVPPKGLEMNPYPLDLTVHVPQHPADGEIFQFISNGFPGTAMRAWGEGEGALTDEQIWHLVNYLRTLGEQTQ